jgi:hypothetical protein
MATHNKEFGDSQRDNVQIEMLEKLKVPIFSLVRGKKFNFGGL